MPVQQLLGSLPELTVKGDEESLRWSADERLPIVLRVEATREGYLGVQPGSAKRRSVRRVSSGILYGAEVACTSRLSRTVNELDRALVPSILSPCQSLSIDVVQRCD